MTKNNIPLPSGFHDVLPPFEALEASLIAKLVGEFESFGYMRIKPPMIEFTDSGILEGKCFELMDPISHKMMRIRPDMTMQVARIAALRLKNSPRPLRLCYSGQVLRAEGEGLYAERQIAQTGVELIGDDSHFSDAEVVLLAISSMEKCNIRNISIDFNIPRLSGIIMDSSGTPESSMDNILSLIEKKDSESIVAMNDKSSALLASLTSLSGSAVYVIEKLKTFDLPKEGKKLCCNLQEIISAVKKANPDISITIDPLERRGFEYHNGISFSFFSKDSSEELGRGGRYNIALNNESAVGFTLVVNAIQRLFSSSENTEKVFLPFRTTWEESSKIRKKGYSVIHGLSNVDDSNKEAVRLGCNRMYCNEKVIKINV